MEPLHEDIDQLIADKLSDQISVEDDLRLKHLIKTDDYVRKQWKQSLASVLLYKASNKASSTDEEAAWNKIADQLEQAQPMFKMKSGRRKWLVAATILLPLVAAGLWFGVFQKSLSGQKDTLSKNERVKITLSDGTTYTLDAKGVTTGKIHFGAESANRLAQSDNSLRSAEIITLSIPNGKTYDLVLDDGTSVKINSASVLKFPVAFTGEKREVVLDGEAYFEVAKSKKPFIVKTNDMDVKVLGTKFNVNTYPGYNAQTSLLEGSVSVLSLNHSKEIFIKPGQAAIVKGDNLLTVEKFSSDDVLSWLNGTYYFTNMPLREIVNITNRVTGEDIYITDSRLSNQRFSGALKTDNPIKVLLENIKSSSADVQYRFRDGRIELY